MTFGGFTYGGAPYGSSAPSSAPVTVDLAPAVVDVVAPVVEPATAEIFVSLRPAVVEVVGATTTVKVGTRIDLAPAVVDVAGPRVTVIQSGGVNLAAAVVEVAAPTLIVTSVGLRPAVVELAAPRMPRRVSIQAWTADDLLSTAALLEVQIEVDTTFADPTAESGWQPIRTNRITWASIEVDTDTGRPTTPATTVSVPLEPAAVELVGAAAQF